LAHPLRNLWIHSYEVALPGGALSDIIPMTTPRECFLSGRLHNIGRIIFYRMSPQKFHDLSIADDLLEREKAIFGCTHADAGSWFAEETYMLPEILVSIQISPSTVQCPHSTKTRLRSSLSQRPFLPGLARKWRMMAYGMRSMTRFCWSFR
jgi:hypothetical protein